MKYATIFTTLTYLEFCHPQHTVNYYWRYEQCIYGKYPNSTFHLMMLTTHTVCTTCRSNLWICLSSATCSICLPCLGAKLQMNETPSHQYGHSTLAINKYHFQCNENLTALMFTTWTLYVSLFDWNYHQHLTTLIPTNNKKAKQKQRIKTYHPYWSWALTLVCKANRVMAKHTTVTIPMVIITMYVSWKADIVAAQYDMESVCNIKTNITTAQCHMDKIWNIKNFTSCQHHMESVWNTNQISHQPNVTWTDPVTLKDNTSPMWHGEGLEHKQISQQPHVKWKSAWKITDIRTAQCQMKSAWNRKQVSHQPNVKWTGP